MALSLRDCAFFGSAISESFALNDLEGVLAKEKLLEKPTGATRQQLEESWDSYRRKLRALGDQGGVHRVRHHVVDPLADRLGYGPPEAAGSVRTREDEEDGGFLYSATNGAKLRAWAVDLGSDLDAPNRRGRAYRFSPARVAERVLLAAGERVGLLTDGDELRVVIVDPARPGSHVAVALGRSGGWRGAQAVPDSYRLVRALASPAGVARIGAITEAARLAQTRVTRGLRDQARRAVEGFVQALMDHTSNAPALAEWTDRDALARTLWREGLVVVYRLLFILKLESSADPARAFSFASTSLWRNTYSPNVALAPVVRDVVERGAVTGSFLADTLRATFRLFSEGLSSSELKVGALGGMLFGTESAPLVSRLAWTEEGVAALLDNLLWTRERGQDARSRVHYGSLDVEDLGRVYEALLELEPGIADRPMCRLRRAKLEVVVDAAAGEPYRAAANPEQDAAEDEDQEEDSRDDDGPKRGKAKTAWVEDIRKGRFFLRVGLGRKATGSYYTPHPFVRFLVQETLAPQVSERSPANDPKPGEILKLKVLDPAMGSGHFLVEACRFLGEKLYEATRLCDGLAADAERAAAKQKDAAEREPLVGRARELRRRVEDLPDPNDELLAYLPSRAAEGEESGLSQSRALAICRRLVAVHCLYGVDKNPLAVELAKVSLWLESYAEGLPLTFLDHRLVCGDSLTAPFFRHLTSDPVTGKPVEGLFMQRLGARLAATLAGAVQHVRDLEASVGKDAADLEHKRAAKARLDEALASFRTLSEVWSGLAMLGADAADPQGWEELLSTVADGGALDPVIDGRPALRAARTEGKGCAPYEFLFPEVFFPGGDPARRGGFDSVVGNPPWDAIQFKSKELLATFDLRILEAPTAREREGVEAELLNNPEIRRTYDVEQERFERRKRLNDALFVHQKVAIGDDLAGRQLDEFRVFMERNAEMIGSGARTGVVVPSAFHANEGATGVRHLYLKDLSLVCCFSFENRKKLFEIHSSFKFAVVVAERNGSAMTSFQCAYYLHDLEWLFERRGALTYTRAFVEATGGEYLTFLEARDERQAAAIEAMFRAPARLREVFKRLGVTPNTSELPMLGGDTFLAAPEEDVRLPEVARKLAASGIVPLHEGKTFHQFTDLWAERPRYVVRLAGLADRPRWLYLARHFRFAYRAIASSTNERTAIATVLPPPSVSTRKAASDVSAGAHPNWCSLWLAAFMNTFSLDYVLRAMVQTDVGLFIVERLPVPLLESSHVFLAHAALRLMANHEGFGPLWREQLGSEWREPEGKRPRFPVIEGDDARWAVRAAIDAVVTDAYGLERADYEHVLSRFSHKSYPAAPARCLEAYDELKRLGLARFCKKHDPYFDVPLVEALPKPALELPVPGEVTIPLANQKKGRSARALEAGQQGTLNIGDRLQRTRDEEQPDVSELGPAQASPRVAHGAATGIADGRKEKVAILAAQIRAIEERTKKKERVVVDLPVYNLRAAAGSFDESQFVGTAQTMKFRASRAYTRRRGEFFFVAQIDGRSMEPSIPNGAWCVFRRPAAAILDGARVLVERHLAEDPERGGRYVVKDYRKDATGRPQLISTNSAFAPIEITDADRIIAEWVEVIEPVTAKGAKR